MHLTNASKLPISIAVWLGTDNYDYSDNPNTISATTLNKPIRAVVLARQNKDLIKIGDVEGLIPSRMGTAFHSAIESAWINPANLRNVMIRLGYPLNIIDRVVVNPTNEQLVDGAIPVYMEIRGEKEILGFIVTGKFDFCIEGRLEDFKSTSAYAYIMNSNVDSYIKQGSVYRWLHPEIITDDHMSIQYIFTDWSAQLARQNKDYPKKRILTQTLPLMSIPETETYVRGVLNSINSLMGATQEQLPLCTPEDLWQKPDVFKYYKNPDKQERSTKNFDTYREAHARLVADGNVGVINTVKGSITRCKYCEVAGICDQAQGYVTQGILEL